MVDTDGVCANGLHEGRVETALLRVDKRVIWDQLVRNPCFQSKTPIFQFHPVESCKRTLDEELIALAGKELGALDLDCGNGRSGSTQAGQQCQR